MQPGKIGVITLAIGLIASLLTIVGYLVCLKMPQSRRARLFARLGYSLTAASVLTTFGILASLVYAKNYHYAYVVEHTGNDVKAWYRFAATWAGQEGSFLLWATWTSIIGFLVFAKAGKYEARVMPFFVSILGFLCAILLKQTPFSIVPPLSPQMPQPPDGMGLTPSLQNYWMTIHPPTIFFGFASLAVPFCYAIAAMIWRDYDGWASRVMPYALLSVATLGLGLFMGGYWAYETQGWHGFWGWDPVENASFFPWLAVTALAHGLVVQKSRGGMARTNTFLGFFPFWLFLLGTFLTRSGALASKDASGQMLSVHAFDNIGKSALSLMVAMLVLYGVLGLGLWLWRLRSMPTRQTTGETLVSRDFAFFTAVLLMLIACVLVTLGTTQPLFQSWMHQAASAPKPAFYNKVMLPLAMLAAFAMGCVPWLAWRRTDPDRFLRKLLVPWIGMIAFGFLFLLWVLAAERALQASLDVSSIETAETLRAWISAKVQRMAVVALASLGFFAALSNAALAYRVFRAKPLSAGGWLAHVGIGIFIIGVIVSNTYERTERFVLTQGEGPKEAFGYKFEFEKMTGKRLEGRPINPDYDKENTVQIRVTPPDAESGGSADGAKTFLINPRWFVWNMNRPSEEQFERMRWPHIQKYFGHDLYVGFANDPGYKLPVVTLQPGQHQQVGPYNIFYYQAKIEPMKYMGADVFLKSAEGKIVQAQPGFRMETSQGDDGKPAMAKFDTNVAIPELKDDQGVPGAIYLRSLQPGTREATFLMSLPGLEGQWEIPLEVTFKPWINLVWLGVLIAVAGTLLAMVRRALEARKITDAVPAGGEAEPEREPWEIPEQAEPGGAKPGGARVPAAGRAITTEAEPAASLPARKRKLRSDPSKA
jgi:cytochrome c-type biogenesis protein CcmF